MCVNVSTVAEHDIEYRVATLSDLRTSNRFNPEVRRAALINREPMRQRYAGAIRISDQEVTDSRE